MTLAGAGGGWFGGGVTGGGGRACAVVALALLACLAAVSVSEAQQAEYCNGQGPAARLGFDIQCEAIVPAAINSPTNPSASCLAIQDAYPPAPDGAYYLTDATNSSLVTKSYCFMSNPKGASVDNGDSMYNRGVLCANLWTDNYKLEYPKNLEVATKLGHHQRSLVQDANDPNMLWNSVSASSKIVKWNLELGTQVKEWTQYTDTNGNTQNFAHPEGMDTGPDGKVYATQVTSAKIMVAEPPDYETFKELKWSSGSIVSGRGSAVNADGTILYTSSTDNGRSIYRIDRSDNSVTIVKDQNGAYLNLYGGVFMDINPVDGRLYYIDYANGMRISAWNPVDNVVQKGGLYGDATFSHHNNNGGLVIDNEGNMVVSSTHNMDVVKPDGTIKRIYPNSAVPTATNQLYGNPYAGVVSTGETAASSSRELSAIRSP
eukprot:CAMPEP_0197590838 /NCGR_PEP_ID=MMETSP1326-20131121/12241_1 /TAXON_ID=1155430 /ORGANISM="Genus nov. species nov., Strain RCC2288" /LENGTH=430 /DNA_ID=CAMNT_0043156119 /DNA_START=185 /DNA_END=1481 /DNA_ORIENTATION=-